MKKIIYIVLTIMLVMGVFIGCSNKNIGETKEGAKVEQTKDSVVTKKEKGEEKITVVVSGPKAPPTFPLLRMMETKALGENIEFDLKVWNSVEEMLAIVSKPDFDFLGVPMNVAAKFYNKGLDVELLNVNTWGVMYFATTDADLRDWKDLKGKEIYVPYKSAPPDIITQRFIDQAGLDPQNDVKINYSTPPEIAQLFKSGTIKYAMNLEPFITASLMENQNKNARIAFDYMEEWKKIEGNQYDIPNAGIITSHKFSSENKDLVDKFQEEYNKALKWTIENPAETGVLAEKYLELNPKLFEKAMPRLGLNFKTAQEAKKDLAKYYEVLVKFMPESIGGKIPDESFYYKK